MVPVVDAPADSSASEAIAHPRFPDVIDCDVHNTVPSEKALFPYLPEHWREFINVTGFWRGPVSSYPAESPVTKPRAFQTGSHPLGSELRDVQENLLDRFRVRYAILNCLYAVESLRHPDFSAALASAVNDWQITEWLEKEPRLRASVVVPSLYPELAAAEIDRVGSHPGFVQVLLPVRSEVPYGNRRYHPLFEAAVRHNLVVGIHFGGATGAPPTPVGWPTYFIEEYVGVCQAFQAQLVSLVAEGVFAKFPTLRVTMIEGGFAWLPALLWRLDKDWKGLRREVPWVRRLPSEYIRDHVRFTLQPNDGPDDTKQLLEIVEQIGSESMLMFSTDFPHGHGQRPDEALAPFPDGLARMIASTNALTWYTF